MPAPRRGRLIAVTLVGVAIVAVGYLTWVFLLSIGTTEGDVPDRSRIDLPAGAEVIGEDRGCASGGCWLTLTVRPPAGQSALELAEEIGATPQLELPGTVLDPRTVRVWAEPSGGTLSLRADFWSQKHVP